MSAIKKTNPKTKKSSKGKVIQLNVFRQPNQTETEQLIKAVLNVAQSALWFNKNFSSKEKENLKELIADHFYNGKNEKTNFKELIERICLAKRYVARKRGRYISKPQDWLNIHYPLGLAGTAAWLKQVNEVRKDVPEYNKGIKTFATAILKFIENPQAVTFYRYRRLLMEQKQFDLLQILNNTLINLQYSL
ncbi:MAG: hypothetical protein Q8T03_13415 [Bacteroidota bacterium]|nr:hypothetical protein [Bacteroidota bacterium]MDP3558365.1 hypothetical protein [Bacteroidota bacterium]